MSGRAARGEGAAGGDSWGPVWPERSEHGNRAWRGPKAGLRGTVGAPGCFRHVRRPACVSSCACLHVRLRAGFRVPRDALVSPGACVLVRVCIHLGAMGLGAAGMLAGVRVSKQDPEGWRGQPGQVGVTCSALGEWTRGTMLG